MINVRCGPLYGLKSDISRGPGSAISRHHAVQQISTAIRLPRWVAI